jgi:DNA-binding transcriptional LysR family regulator
MAKARRRSRDQLDLNLVRTLDALLAERNVTRAAARVGLTQSAASHALQRLRDHFDDPLLVRTAVGMTLTERAAALIAPVRDGLQLIERAVDDRADFEPAGARRTFTLAMTDYLGELLLPEVYARIAAEAPGVDLRVVSIVEDVERCLETDGVDLVLSMAAMREVPANLYRKQLFEEPYVCAVRSGHPLLDDEVTLERYCSAAHVLVAPRGGRGVVDRMLARARPRAPDRDRGTAFLRRTADAPWPCAHGHALIYRAYIRRSLTRPRYARYEVIE